MISDHPMEEAVIHDLAELPLNLRHGAVAAVALNCARELDGGALPPRDASSYLREIRLSMAQLREMTTGDVKGDVTDEVRERREKRLAGGA